MAKVATRAEIDEKYKWNLYDIIADEEAWEREYSDLSARADKIAAFKGKLKDGDTVFACLTDNDELSQRLEKLYVFASMKSHEDESVSKYQSMRSRAEILAVKMSAESSFIIPELGKLSDETLRGFAAEERFAPFAYTLRELIRNKPHILSEEEERLLANVGTFSGGFSDIFSMIDNVDITFRPVRADGELVEMSHGKYSTLMQNPSRSVRKRAFESMFNAYKGLIHVISAVYGNSVKKDVFYAKVRRHDSALKAALFGEDIDPSVYDNLIEAVHSALPAVHEYVDYRKKALKVDKIHMYDMYTPIVKGVSLKLSYEEACKLVREGLQPLGEDYAKLLDEAFRDRWIDVFESKGKRSGAYSWGAYGTHPYVLMNFEGNTHDVFTLAHELGHAMHTYYSNESQPHASCDYQIFVAEIASTVNETLMLKYLLKKTEDRNMKRYLLSYYLDMFRTTVFRQTMFAEFEKFSHESVEKDIPLDCDNMSDKYFELNKTYYGEQCDDDLIRYEWARIPHFYRSFYVYKYATGLIAAVSIVKGITDGKPDALKNYKAFLSAGGSMSPLDTLRLAGIDLTEKAAFDVAMQEFSSTLDELKRMK